MPGIINNNIKGGGTKELILEGLTTKNKENIFISEILYI
jgi:hypothetical protein